jgi:chaperone required for assembly of F1-ATPase
MIFEPTQEVLMAAIRRYVRAEKTWDTARWGGDSSKTYDAAAELADAKEHLRVLAGEV